MSPRINIDSLLNPEPSSSSSSASHHKQTFSQQSTRPKMSSPLTRPSGVSSHTVSPNVSEANAPKQRHTEVDAELKHKNSPRKNAIWHDQEDERLLDLMKKNGKDWDAIADQFPNRSALSCRARWYTQLKMIHPECDPLTEGQPHKIVNNWSPAEDAQLVELVRKKGKDWPNISAKMNGRSEIGCQARWTRHLRHAHPDIKSPSSIKSEKE